MPKETGAPVYYSVYLPGYDTAVLFHGPLYDMRRRYFASGRRTKCRGAALVAGVESTFAGVMSRGGIRWERRAGKALLEKAYPSADGYMVLCRNLNGNIVSQVRYSKRHLWQRSSYFAEGSTTHPVVTLEPLAEGVLEITEYDGASRAYRRRRLYACPAAIGTRTHSYLNALIGAPCLYASCESGDLCYYDSQEKAARRAEMDRRLKSGAWELVPLPDAEERGLEDALLAEEPQGEAPAKPTLAGQPLSAPQPAEEAFPEDTADQTLIGEDYIYRGGLNDKGERHGRGRTEQESGATAYEGDYRDGKRHGYGAYYYKTGRPCYVGGWKDGRRDGAGVSFRRDTGDIHIGCWRAGAPEGPSCVFDENGRLRFLGRIEDGARRGAAVLQGEDGGYYIGRWQAGSVTGQGSYFDADGVLLYTGSWVCGKRHGQGTSFDRSGNVAFTGEWRDGRYYSGITCGKTEE